MEMQVLNIDYGDIVILTYNEELDVDAINKHFDMIKELIHSKGAIAVANRKDFVTGIQVIKEGDGGYPFK